MGTKQSEGVSALAGFHYTHTGTKVIFGLHSLDQLDRELNAYPRCNVMVICSNSVRKSQLFPKIKDILKDRYAGVYSDIPSHSGEEIVGAAVEEARKVDANLFVAVGGGSVSDTAKAMSILLAEGGTLEEHAFFKPLSNPQIPIIAIPTTASAAEVTPGAGIRNEAGRKLIFWDNKIAASVIILDPNVLMLTPESVIASTSMNALAHSIEGLYSVQRQPISEALALQSIKYLTRGIDKMIGGADSIDAYGDILIGSNLSGTVITNSRVALHHGICHCVGAKFHVPHGVANAIMLPHVMAFNLEAAAELLAMAAEAMGLDTKGVDPLEAGRLAVQKVKDMNAQLHNPVRLRDVGVPKEGLAAIAQDTMLERAIHSNPVKVNVHDVMGILEKAW